MAKANSNGRLNSNNERKSELLASFPIESLHHSDKNKKDIIVKGYWGDRCIIADDNNIYNVEADLLYKFKYSIK